MIHKRVKPVLISSSNKTDLLINTLNNRLLYDCSDIIKEHAKYYQLALISLDHNEKLDEGDCVLWNDQIFKIDSNNAYSNTWNITLGYCRQYKLPKVIATHDQILPKDI